MNWYLIEFEG